MASKDDYERAAAVYPDPRTLYIKDEWYNESPYKPYRGIFTGFFFGLLAKATNNWVKDRPMKAGFHMYVVHGVFWSCVGHLLHVGIDGYTSYRDRIYKHYVATHPADFPPPPKVKIGDKWEPWVPIR